MGFRQVLSVVVNSHKKHLKDMYNKRIQMAETKAKAQLDRAKTMTERKKIRLSLERDKLAAKKELYEAQIATNKAKEAVEKARKEAGDLTVSERVEKLYKYFVNNQSKRRPARKRKVAKRR